MGAREDKSQNAGNAGRSKKMNKRKQEMQIEFWLISQF